MKSASVSASKMKVKSVSKLLAALVVVIFLATSMWSLNARAKEPQLQPDIDAMKWLSQNTPAGAVILARVNEGFMVNYYAQRKKRCRLKLPVHKGL